METDDEWWRRAPKNCLWVWKGDRIGAVVVTMETGLGKSVTKVRYEDLAQL